METNHSNRSTSTKYEKTTKLNLHNGDSKKHTQKVRQIYTDLDRTNKTTQQQYTDLDKQHTDLDQINKNKTKRKASSDTTPLQGDLQQPKICANLMQS